MSKVYKGTLNRVELIGGLKEVPKVNETKEGFIASISLATKRAFKKNAEEFDDNTEWHQVVVKDSKAQFLEKYGRPGMKLFVEGYLRHRKLNLNDIALSNNQKHHYVTEIVAEILEPLESIKSKQMQQDS